MNKIFSSGIFYNLRLLIGVVETKRKLQLLTLLMLMLCTSISELALVLLALPFIASLTSTTGFLSTSSNLHQSSTILTSAGNHAIFLFIGSVVITSLLRLLTLWMNNITAASLGTDLAVRIYNNILNEDYDKHIISSSDFAITVLTIHIDNTVVALNNLFLVWTSCFTAVAVLVGLAKIDFKFLILISSIFVLTYVFLLGRARPWLARTSHNVGITRRLEIKAIQDTIGAFRDILLSSLEGVFTEKFAQLDSKQRWLQSTASFISNSPKIIIECIALVAIATITLFQNNKGGNYLPLLGTFALASQRLLPSLQQVYAGLATVTSLSKDIEEVALRAKSMNKQPTYQPQKLGFEHSIRLLDIGYGYPSSKSDALKSVDLDINRGEVIGLMGPSGCGKSTLLDIIMGLLVPNSGTVELDGNIISHEHFRSVQKSWQSLISHVPQDVFILNDTIYNNIRLAADNKSTSSDDIERACDLALIKDFAETLPNGLETVIGERGARLSGGQRQRIGIARSLVATRPILVLDEATSALDNATESAVMHNIMSNLPDTTIIIVAHRLNTLRSCDKVYKMADGRIIDSGHPQSMIGQW